jgi:uncharacterized protein
MAAEPEFAACLEDIIQDPIAFDFGPWLQPFTEMIKNKVLLSPQEEDDFIEIMKFKKTASRFDSSTLALTILVTEKCNFCCPYCYEKIDSPADMNQETMDGLIDFINFFMPLKKIFITWFGGEPLLRFDVIKKLNTRIKDLGVKMSSIIVTNGWLLTSEVVDYLDELNTSTIQVTIEGPPEIHNKTRIHKDHGGSFDVIQKNLDMLMLEKKWKGRLLVHFNIDDYNFDYYSETVAYWQNRYKGSNVSIGKNFIDRDKRGARDMACSFSRDREIEFYLDHYKNKGGNGLSYYPEKHHFGCIATKRNGFVIGAKGQVYKCWHDIGHDERVVGSIFLHPSKWNWTIISRYMTGVEPFDNPQCRECFLLPVCEDCPHIWYKKKYLNQNVCMCARYKEKLSEFLEIHYETLITKSQ